MRRQILYASSFDDAVGNLGGYRAVDKALEPIIEALDRSPYGFDLIENDFTRVRYAITREVPGVIPALVVIFEITPEHNVELIHVEE